MPENREEDGMVMNKIQNEKGDMRGGREYVKTALYVFPALKVMADEVGEHVKRKAYLSYDNRVSCENLAAYLLEQLELKSRIETLSDTLGGVVDKLSTQEKFLLQLRYFGGKNKTISGCSDEEIKKLCGSRRSYYRRQERLLKKIGEKLLRRGVSEDNFYNEYGEIELVRRVDRALKAGRRAAQSARDEQVLARLDCK